ncbi:hypothetical protein MXB_3161 [Myxobolus squamalis]|nr:hypothetical protein MXB_3161 [Myxobolus squamalis]
MESKDVQHFEFLSTKHSKFQIPNIFYSIFGVLSVSAWVAQSNFQNNNIPLILLKFAVPIILLLKLVCTHVVKIRRILDFTKVKTIKDADHIFIQLNDDGNSCYVVELHTMVLFYASIL